MKLVDDALRAHGVTSERELRAIHASYKQNEKTFREHTKLGGVPETFGRALLRVCSICETSLVLGKP